MERDSTEYDDMTVHHIKGIYGSHRFNLWWTEKVRMMESCDRKIPYKCLFGGADWPGERALEAAQCLMREEVARKRMENKRVFAEEGEE